MYGENACAGKQEAIENTTEEEQQQKVRAEMYLLGPIVRCSVKQGKHWTGACFKADMVAYSGGTVSVTSITSGRHNDVKTNLTQQRWNHNRYNMSVELLWSNLRDW